MKVCDENIDEAGDRGLAQSHLPDLFRPTQHHPRVGSLRWIFFQPRAIDANCCPGIVQLLNFLFYFFIIHLFLFQFFIMSW